jgi:excisionase family DNA binding protein
MEPITLAVNDAAKALGISRVTLYKHINSGAIETVRLGGRRLVKVASLRRLAGLDQSVAA